MAMFMMGLILISSTGLTVQHHLCSMSGKKEISLLGTHSCEKETAKDDCCQSKQKKSKPKDCCEISQTFAKVDFTSQIAETAAPSSNAWVYLLPVFTLSGIVAPEQLAPTLPYFYPDKIPVLSASDKMSLLQTMTC